MSLGPFLLSFCFSGASLAQVQQGDAYDDHQAEHHDESSDPTHSSPPQTGDHALKAGDLKAPASLPEKSDERTKIEKDLDEADQKDAGRGLEFAWLNSELGYQYIALAGIKNGALADSSVSLSSGGLTLGVGAGVRLLYFTFGGRFRAGFLGDFNLWSATAELGFRVPLGIFEPYGILGGGFVAINNLEPGDEFGGDDSRVRGIRGLDTRLATGLDIYFSDSFSVGAQLGGELLFVSRGQDKNSDLCDPNQDCIYQDSGSSTGAALTGSLQFGLHF